MNKVRKTIVVSAVNIRKGGTLTILRDCLRYLSSLTEDFRIVALVHRRELCDYQGIEYIEMPDIIKGWSRRLWCEYVSMYKLSQTLAPVYLWLSMHDTTPYVKAERQAVYCQTSFPFFHWNLNDLSFDYKIVLFALFTRFAYKINIKRNKYLIVQAEWLRKGFSKMFGLSERKFIVAPPRLHGVPNFKRNEGGNDVYTFLYAATPDCHKNFEIICKASKQLEKELGEGKFKVIFTIAGTENKYSRWLYKKWGNITSLKFKGLMEREMLFEYYNQVDCLIFASRIETWGLPISEFIPFEKPMLLADLPYAHEASMGSKYSAFFDVYDAIQLCQYMKKIIMGDKSFLKGVPMQRMANPSVISWKDLFSYLLG